eukprot:6174857-Pleurochrysis_carterae.AAC.6
MSTLVSATKNIVQELQNVLNNLSESPTVASVAIATNVKSSTNASKPVAVSGKVGDNKQANVTVSSNASFLPASKPLAASGKVSDKEQANVTVSSNGSSSKRASKPLAASIKVGGNGQADVTGRNNATSSEFASKAVAVSAKVSGKLKAMIGNAQTAVSGSAPTYEEVWTKNANALFVSLIIYGRMPRQSKLHAWWEEDVKQGGENLKRLAEADGRIKLKLDVLTMCVEWTEKFALILAFVQERARRPLTSSADVNEKTLALWFDKQNEIYTQIVKGSAKPNIPMVYLQAATRWSQLLNYCWARSLASLEKFIDTNKKEPYVTSKDEEEKHIAQWMKKQADIYTRLVNGSTLWPTETWAPDMSI